jgi:hypothetical protein
VVLNLDRRGGGPEQSARRGTTALVWSSWFSSRSRFPAIKAFLASGSVVASTSPTSRTGMPRSRNRRITWAAGTREVV